MSEDTSTDPASSWVCTHCRLVEQFRQSDRAERPRCTGCHEFLHDLGPSFTAPRRRNAKAWRAVTALLRAGVHDSSCGCGGSSPLAPTFAELAEEIRMASTLRSDVAAPPPMSSSSATQPD